MVLNHIIVYTKVTYSMIPNIWYGLSNICRSDTKKFIYLVPLICDSIVKMTLDFDPRNRACVFSN